MTARCINPTTIASAALVGAALLLAFTLGADSARQHDRKTAVWACPDQKVVVADASGRQLMIVIGWESSGGWSTFYCGPDQ